MGYCELDTELRDGLLTVKILHQQITGDLPQSIGEKLKEVVGLDEVRAILLDFKLVEHMSSNFVGELIVLRNQCFSATKRLSVTGLNDKMRTIFTILNLTSVIEIVESSDEALRRLGLADERVQKSSPDIVEIKSRAELGDADAQFLLAVCHEEGNGVEQNQVTAFEMFLQAARNGNPEAQYNVGKAFAYGIAVERDFSKALQWYLKAAEQDHVDAQYALGIEKHYGLASAPDEEDAKKWFKRAASHGHQGAADYLRIISHMEH